MLTSVTPATAQVLTYGDQDTLGFGNYPSDPEAGATVVGLSPGATTLATNQFTHGFPFSPSGGDFPGTDQIYVGSVQTAFHDGYSSFAGRLNGPQVIPMDYSSLVPPGQAVTSLTLGIAADDFQFGAFGQPYIAKINGTTDTALTNLLNSINLTGPADRFVSVGVSLASLLPSNVLTLSIDQGGDGGDGWAVDFLTIGVTAAVPESGTLLLIGAAMPAWYVRRFRRR
jgi:hypothetical protein